MAILYSVRAYWSRPTGNQLLVEKPLTVMRDWSWFSICSNLWTWCDSGLFATLAVLLRHSSWQFAQDSAKKLSYYLRSNSMAHSSGNLNEGGDANEAVRAVDCSWSLQPWWVTVDSWSQWSSTMLHPCKMDTSKFSLMKHLLYSRYFGSFTTQGSTSSIARIRQEKSSHPGWISVSPSQPNE